MGSSFLPTFLITLRSTVVFYKDVILISCLNTKKKSIIDFMAGDATMKQNYACDMCRFVAKNEGKKHTLKKLFSNVKIIEGIMSVFHVFPYVSPLKL